VNLLAAVIYSDSNFLNAKFCTNLKKIIKLQIGKPKRNMENLYSQSQEVVKVMEEIVLHSDAKAELRMCSGTIAIYLCYLL